MRGRSVISVRDIRNYAAALARAGHFEELVEEYGLSVAIQRFLEERKECFINACLQCLFDMEKRLQITESISHHILPIFGANENYKEALINIFFRCLTECYDKIDSEAAKENLYLLAMLHFVKDKQSAATISVKETAAKFLEKYSCMRSQKELEKLLMKYNADPMITERLGPAVNMLCFSIMINLFFGYLKPAIHKKWDFYNNLSSYDAMRIILTFLFLFAGFYFSQYYSPERVLFGGRSHKHLLGKIAQELNIAPEGLSFQLQTSLHIS